MASATLQGLPVEMTHEICGHLELQDLNTLRRVNRYFCAIASSHTLKRLKFCMCKRDLDMLRQITNNPIYAGYIQGLVYVVETLSLERQTFEMYARAIERDEMLKRSLQRYNSPLRAESPARTYLPSEIREQHRRYTHPSRFAAAGRFRAPHCRYIVEKILENILENILEGTSGLKTFRPLMLLW